MADADPSPVQIEPHTAGPDQQPKGDGAVDSPPHPGTVGTAPPKGERLEGDTQSQRAEQPRTEEGPGRDQQVKEGAVYKTPDGEERLVWVVRNGITEFFARRPGGRWRATLQDRGLVATEAFAREVGLRPT